MATNLQLVNRLAQESGVTGNASAVATVTAQTGEAARLVEWIRKAHNDIQNRHPQWRWMRSTFTVNTVASTDTYAPTACTDSRLSVAVSRFARWWTHDWEGMPNIKRYLTSGGVGGEGYLNYLPWSYFRAIYKINVQANGQPVDFTVDPQNNLVLGPKPSDIYTVTGEYQMSALDFSADADTPEFPARFHDLVVYEAMMRYGRFHSASEVFQGGSIDGKRLMRQLEADQLPMIGLGAPLA